MPTTQRSQLKTAQKCTCGMNRKLYCAKCSKVRMVIALKNNNDNLKIGRDDESLANPVWYSFLKYNTKDIYTISSKMEEKVRTHPELSQAANVLLFYINGDRTHYFHKVNL